MKICKTCNLKLEDSDFYKNRIYLLSTCKKCHNKSRLSYQSNYRKENSDKVKLFLNPEKRLKSNQLKKESNIRNVVHVLWKRTKDRALKKGLDFDLLESEIIIPDKCPILEIPIFVGSRKDYKNSPTIDRIDNCKGYTKDNIKIISMLANTMKNSASVNELEMFCKNILKYMENKDDIV